MNAIDNATPVLQVFSVVWLQRYLLKRSGDKNDRAVLSSPTSRCMRRSTRSSISSCDQ